jgi:hypothetical protein
MIHDPIIESHMSVSYQYRILPHVRHQIRHTSDPEGIEKVENYLRTIIMPTIIHLLLENCSI